MIIILYRKVDMTVEKYNSTYDHYENQEYYVIKDYNEKKDWERYFGGCYGPYWTAHFGGGYHKFLKRRSNELATYNDKNPLINWYRRKLDERAWHVDWPRGQDYESAISWFVWVYLFY